MPSLPGFEKKWCRSCSRRLSFTNRSGLCGKCYPKRERYGLNTPKGGKR